MWSRYLPNKKGLDQAQEATQTAMDEIKEQLADGYNHTLTLYAQDKVDGIHDEIETMDFNSFLSSIGGAKKDKI